MLLCLCLCLCLVAGAQAAGLEVADLPDGGVALGPHWSLQRDPTRRLDLAQARKGSWIATEVRGEALSFGYTQDAAWLRLPLHNAGARPVKAMLDISYPLLQYLDVHIERGSGAVQSLALGYERPYAERPWPGGNFAIPVELGAGESVTLWLRAASDNSLIVPGRLWRAEDFVSFDQRRLFLQALYFGLALAVASYNLLVFLYLRDASFGWYVLLASSMAMIMACFSGVGLAFLWPDWPAWQMRCINVAGSVASIAMLMFSRRMLNMPVTMPALDRLLRVFVVLHALFIPALIAAFATAAPLWVISSGLTAAVLLLCGLNGALQRQRSAYFFVVAFSALLVAVVLGHLRNLGILPATLITSAGTQLGSAMDLLLLSLALADYYARMRAEKDQALAQALAAEQARVEALRDSEKALEARVQERTAALASVNTQLERMSQTDGLTGLANRRHFDTTLAAEWARAQRGRTPLGLGLLDLDHFKAYNDSLGHVAGDDCLRQLAQVMQDTVGRRSGELVARYGGEEFAFILPGAGGPELQAVAERLRQALRERGIAHPSRPEGLVTASIGVAAMVPRTGQRPEDLLAAADAALYAAKAGGRDRVTLAQGPDQA